MTTIRLLTYLTTGLYMLDALVELGFVGAVLAWLSGRANRTFEVTYGSSAYLLHGRPAHQHIAPLYTSLAASIAAFVLIGLMGILCFFLQSRLDLWRRRWPHVIYTLWIMFLNGSAALCLAALTYTWIANSKNDPGMIDLDMVVLVGENVAYPIGTWTPESWFNAVLKLDLVQDTDRGEIKTHLALLRGWRINLIPLFIMGVAVSVFGHWDAVQRRKKLKERKQHEMQESRIHGSGQA